MSGSTGHEQHCLASVNVDLYKAVNALQEKELREKVEYCDRLQMELAFQRYLPDVLKNDGRACPTIDPHHINFHCLCNTWIPCEHCI